MANEDIQATAEAVADQLSATIAGLPLDEALQVCDALQDRLTAERARLHDDFVLAQVAPDNPRPEEGSGRSRNDQLDDAHELGTPMPTVQSIEGPADLSDLEKQVK